MSGVDCVALWGHRVYVCMRVLCGGAPAVPWWLPVCGKFVICGVGGWRGDAYSGTACFGASFVGN